MPNHLANATSPYLLAHASNPVEWYPWGDEALARAAREDKPIFLSIGYAACHWCHVMAHESFEDPETAAYMNDHFVNIKVDREERPDLDAIYMDAVVAMTGSGGWPLSAFLTPQGNPFFGGTYFPPVPRGQMPSFRQVLEGVAELWARDRARAQSAGADLRAQLAARATVTPPGSSELDPSVEARAAERLFSAYDWSHGGWGGAPKFPQATAVAFLLRKAILTADSLARDMAVHGLEKMADGGIFDHLGGGFARYSVDSNWRIPHFEKMLYDNALLAGTFLHAWQLTKRPKLLGVHRAILTFLLEETRAPEGGFYASIDADSEGEEGRFYTWDRQTIQAELGSTDTYDLFAAAFGLEGAPNFDGKYVLWRAVRDRQLAERFGLPETEVVKRLDDARHRLYESRRKRIPPAIDDKVIVAWNGYLLRTLANSARALGDRAYRSAAVSLAEFLQSELWHEGRLFRSWRAGRTSHEGYLEDYASLGLGCLSLYELTFDHHWYEFALRLGHEILNRFSDPQGGFFDTSDAAAHLIARPKSEQDSPTPSGGAQATELLLRLSAFSDDKEGFSEPASRALAGMQGLMVQHPTAFATWLCDFSLAVRPSRQLAIVGDIEADGFKALRAVADQPFIPNLVLAGSSASEVGQPPPLLDNRPSVGGRATAYLCRDFICLKPTNDPAVLEDQLREAL